jgi:hypothetical protein
MYFPILESKYDSLNIIILCSKLNIIVIISLDPSQGYYIYSSLASTQYMGRGVWEVKS